MKPDVPMVLRATATAISALLIAVAVQKPLVENLAETDVKLRQSFDRLSQTGIWKILLALSVINPVGVATSTAQTVLRNVSAWVLAFSGVGLLTGVALQAVPADYWNDQLADYAWLVTVFHVLILAQLLAIVINGALSYAKATASAGTPDTSPPPARSDQPGAPS